MPEIVVKHEDINRPDKVTQEMVKKFEEAGCDIHKNDVLEIDDNFKTGQRHVKIKGRTKYFFMGK